MIKKLIAVIFILSTVIVFSQTKKQIVFYNNEKITVVLTDLEKKFDVKFSYPSNLITDDTIYLDKKERSLSDVLFEITYITNINFNQLDSRYIYLSKINSEKLDKVVINSYLTTGVSKNNDASYLINLKKLGLLAGLTEQDVLESIQQLPGVVSINENATELSVRGGNSDQNRLIWDGINIYHSGHLFGMVSVFNPNIANTVSFINKGTNAKYGQRISSVIDVNTSNKIAKKTHLEFGLNGISSDVVLEMPIIKNKLSIQTSFRRSYEDLYETKTFYRYEEKAFQNTNILEEDFHFKDYNVKLNFKPNKNNDFYFSLIHIDNDLYNNYEEDNSTNYFDELDTENNGYSLKWNKKWNKKYSLTSQISHSHYFLEFSSEKKIANELTSIFHKTNKILNTDFSTTLHIKQKEFNTIDLGYQNSVKNIDFLFKEDKDIVYLLDQDTSQITTHAIFINYNLNNLKLFDFYLGGRLNYYQQLNQFKFEPRLVLNKKLNQYLKIQVTGEVKNQIISHINETVLSNLTLEKKIWRLADGKDYPIINSYQISSSLIFTKDKWTADLDFYYKNTKGLTSLALGFLNPLDNTFHQGIQKANGIDFYLKREFTHFNTWISYSFMDVKNKYEQINNNAFFTANNNITHVISASTSYHIKNFDISLAWKYRTGKPLTDLDYDNDGNAYFDGINTEQVPDYHRLDLSSTYEFDLTKKIKSKVGVSLRNLYNKKNHISTDFEGNNTVDDPIRIVNHYGIRFTPNFLFRLYW